MPDPIPVPRRHGPRPQTTDCAPHSHIDQLASDRCAMSAMLMSRLADLPHVELGASRRAPPGTIGLYIEAAHCCAGEQAFLLGREFAHVHVEDDGSLHAILAEPLRTAAIDAGWAEPHPLAGQPTVSPDTVMLYAPRDVAEVGVIASLVKASWANACAVASPDAG